MKEFGFGVDLGGTTTKLGLFKTDGMLLDKWEIRTDTGGHGENILRDIARSVHDKMGEKGLIIDQIQGIGIGVPGPVTSDGVVNKAVNLGWDVVPVQAELAELSGMKVRVGNDANVAALGESWMGAGKDFNSILCVTLGTGIGGGIIIDDQIVYGAHGAGGEIGHMTVNPNEELTCGCGRHGCIEQYASATGFARMTRKMLSETDMPSTLRSVPNDRISAKTLFDAVKAGDTLANQIADRTCGMLAKALSNVCVVVDPEAIVIGGGVSKAGPILIEKIEPAFREAAFHACKDTNIVLATLGNDAGIYGSMKLVMERKAS